MERLVGGPQAGTSDPPHYQGSWEWVDNDDIGRECGSTYSTELLTYNCFFVMDIGHDFQGHFMYVSGCIYSIKIDNQEHLHGQSMIYIKTKLMLF